MKGIVIAAGLGSRMGPFTQTRPKCLLPIAGRTLLERTIDNLRGAGCDEIVVVVGHKAEMITGMRLGPGVGYVTNHDYADNNILHSFMTARDHLDGPVIVTYSDIWVEPWIYDRLNGTGGDLVVAVDRDWLPYYDGRTDHPLSEAENAYFGGDGELECIGKHLGASAPSPWGSGEFLGLWCMSAEGTRLFRATFDEIDAGRHPSDPFQSAKTWRKAYVTDFFQELLDRSESVQCALFERGWAELDTAQDYDRLSDIAELQRLDTIVDGRVRR